MSLSAASMMAKSTTTQKSDVKVWVEDSVTGTCLVCSGTFTSTWYRSGKHLCRNCGLVICEKCVADEKMLVLNTLTPWYKGFEIQDYHSVCINCLPNLWTKEDITNMEAKLVEDITVIKQKFREGYYQANNSVIIEESI